MIRRNAVRKGLLEGLLKGVLQGGRTVWRDAVRKGWLKEMLRGVGSGSGGTPSGTDRWKECYKEVGVGPEGRRHERTHVKDCRKHYYKEEGWIWRDTVKKGLWKGLLQGEGWVRRDAVKKRLLQGLLQGEGGGSGGTPSGKDY